MAKTPLSGNPMILSAAIQLFYDLAAKLTEEEKMLLNEVDDLEGSRTVIKNAFLGRDLLDAK
jgi:hypothetical protein